ncbi:MAG TPA: CHAD domain-containing protein [Halothiobacillaceae bacterium]|nr:CHAD domain-containing protein [Halothiobacillaceae bacterium]
MTEKKQIKAITTGKRIWHKPAGEVLADVIQEKEKTFLKAWAHYQKAEDDPEALHDMRVDLRRLRVWEKLARDQVKTHKPTRKRLKALAKASNPLRDHEVTLDWLDAARRDLPQSDALNQLVEYGHKAYTERTELAFSEKPGLKPKLKNKKGPSLALWLHQTVDQRISVIDEQLRAGADMAHEARIGIKYLRYLLEPFISELPAAKDTVAWCKHVQDALGDFHDIEVFREHLPEFARWVIEHELAEVAALQGEQSQAITKVFANARDPIIALSGWQHQQYERHWSIWADKRDKQLDILQRNTANLLPQIEEKLDVGQ